VFVKQQCTGSRFESRTFVLQAASRHLQLECSLDVERCARIEGGTLEDVQSGNEDCGRRGWRWGLDSQPKNLHACRAPILVCRLPRLAAWQMEGQRVGLQPGDH